MIAHINITCRRRLPDTKRVKSVQNFIHLNLSTSLLLAFIVYVLGVETADGNTVSNLSLSLSLSPLYSPLPSFPSSLSSPPHIILQDGCTFVAVILHYLFLSAFCWMLCEGVLLYLLLRVVFSEMAKMWWPFLLIGYGKYWTTHTYLLNDKLSLLFPPKLVTPLPIVIITVGARHEYYGVRDECGGLL